MNKTLLLFIVDFLFLNLIALTRWERAAPARAGQPPVNAVSANSTSKDQDLVEAMRQSLADEQGARQATEQRLSSAESMLAARERSLGDVQAESKRLAGQLLDTQKAQADLNVRYQAQVQDDALTKSQLAQIQRDLEDKKAEAERARLALAALEKAKADADRRIEGLAVQVAVGEREKQQLEARAGELQAQVQQERTERAKVEQQTVQLAQGVGQLARDSGELTREIRDNRPVSANVLFNDFLANRVQTSFTATRKGLFGLASKDKEARTVFTSDGKQVYALVEIDDTPLSFAESGANWQKVTAEFTRAPDYRSAGSRIDFLRVDPRVVCVPVDPAQVSALGAKVYPLASDPFKFPDALLISGGGQGYGELGFKVDPEHRGYVRVDNRIFKRLFGDFAPSRGDLVFSRTGELLGIMVNSDYCALLGDFTAAATLEAAAPPSDQTAAQIDALAARVRQMPIELQ